MLIGPEKFVDGCFPALTVEGSQYCDDCGPQFTIRDGGLHLVQQIVEVRSTPTCAAADAVKTSPRASTAQRVTRPTWSGARCKSSHRRQLWQSMLIVARDH
jgi:hypothetical protein